MEPVTPTMATTDSKSNVHARRLDIEVEPNFQSAAVQTSTSTSRLLNLPGELRELIYEFFFSDQTYEILSRGHIRDVMQLANQDRTSQNLASRKIVKIPTNALALSLTCRQIYQETLSSPLRYSTFSAKSLVYLTQYYENLSSPTRWYGSMDVEYQRNVVRSIIHSMKSLEIHLPYAQWMFSEIFPLGAKSDNATAAEIDLDKADILRYMDKLERLHFYGEVDPRSEDSMKDSVLAFVVAVQQLQIFMLDVEVTAELEYRHIDGIKRSHFISKPAEKNKWTLYTSALDDLGLCQ
jgi:hypothetical protein